MFFSNIFNLILKINDEDYTIQMDRIRPNFNKYFSVCRYYSFIMKLYDQTKQFAYKTKKT